MRYSQDIILNIKLNDKFQYQKIDSSTNIPSNLQSLQQKLLSETGFIEWKKF